MDSLILCHSKRAKRPYEISRVHMRIYTIEELCYYLCNNLYLIDYTIMNRRLCDWLEDELGLAKMAEDLRRDLDQNATLEEFVLTILKGSVIYAPSEIVKIQNLLEQLKNQRDVERAKYKADSLMKSGEYESAILVYQSILSQDWDESVNKNFYGKIYGCLGSAYGYLFLYKEAALMFKEAYSICEKEDMLKAYIYCCYRGLSEKDYVKMLSGNSMFLSMSAKIKAEMEEAKKENDLDFSDEKLITWKSENRRIDKKS